MDKMKWKMKNGSKQEILHNFVWGNVKLERAHRVANKEKSKKGTTVPKFASFKDKQKILEKPRNYKISTLIYQH